MTQTLGQSKWKSSTSLHMNKASVRTWLYYKNIRVANWVTTAVTALQYQGVDTPLMNPVDMDVITVGNQSPMTFNTQAELWSFFLVDRGFVKLRWNLQNIQPALGNQITRLLSVSWFDTAPTGAALMTAFAAATPAININNIKERFKQVAFAQVREHSFSVASGPMPNIHMSRSWNLNSLMGFKAPWETNVISPVNPGTIGLGFQFYGNANIAPVAPVAQWYHHWVIINIGQLTSTASGLYPISEATTGQIVQDCAMYTKFYIPITYATVLDI